MTLIANGHLVTDMDCVRAYFESHGDRELFEDICRSHHGTAWFEEGIRLGYSLSVIYAISKNTEAAARQAQQDVA